MTQQVPDEWRKPREETRYHNEPDDDVLGDRDWFDFLVGRPVGGPHQPCSEYEALLQCAPGDEPSTSLAESMALREAIAQAIEHLPPRERWVFDAIYTEGKSLRAIGRDLAYSKSQVANVRDLAVTALRAMLANDPEVRRYFDARQRSHP